MIADEENQSQSAWYLVNGTGQSFGNIAHNLPIFHPGWLSGAVSFLQAWKSTYGATANYHQDCRRKWGGFLRNWMDACPDYRAIMLVSSLQVER